jgi:hypothetical protein
MDAIINVITKDNTITVNYPITFDLVELPYGCQGYRFNGTSLASNETLEAYWAFIDQVFAQYNIPTNDYVTLKNIVVGNIVYGVS